jgi:hypothetical protein
MTDFDPTESICVCTLHGARHVRRTDGGYVCLAHTWTRAIAGGRRMFPFASRWVGPPCGGHREWLVECHSTGAHLQWGESPAVRQLFGA